MSIEVKLDTPIEADGTQRHVLVIQTPIQIGALQGITTVPDSTTALLRLIENIAGLPRGAAEQLTIEDYCKVLEAVTPLLAPFNRFPKPEQS